jgi:hypothetical protein
MISLNDVDDHPAGFCVSCFRIKTPDIGPYPPV